MKRLCQGISNLEAKVRQEDSMDDTDAVMSSRVMLKGREVENDDLRVRLTPFLPPLFSPYTAFSSHFICFRAL